ncbi:IPT/TIG domain-containing protein [Kitasatospora indigofera]|uniref:IPT/TIG domain-containing protein n=1 Tax=Kitasatospora indigofera TaxID=67307 RepID=UPI0036AC316D
MIIKLAKAGLAAALALTSLSAAGATTASAAGPVQGPDLAVSQSGNYPIFPIDNTNMGVTWSSAGTADVTGATHLTVELPPGVTTDGALMYSVPPDFTFTQTVSADHRRLEATFVGTRRPGRSDFMKVQLGTHGTVRPSGTIRVTASNRDDADLSDNVSSYAIGVGPIASAAPAAPAVTAIDTTTGPAAGGTAVTVTGTALDNGFVLFGDRPATGGCTSTSCAVTAPAGAGSLPVTVVTPGGHADAPAAFGYVGTPPVPAAPVVTSIGTATGGPAAGGTALTVLGSGLTYGTVAFGGVPATHVSCGPTACTAVSPAGTGTVDVTVTTPGGTSAPVTADRFTYTA